MLSSLHSSNLFLTFPVTLGCHSPQGTKAALRPIEATPRGAMAAEAVLHFVGAQA